MRKTKTLPKKYNLGVPLSYNVGDRIEYEKALRTLVAKMAKATKAQLEKFFNSGTADDYFESRAAMDESISGGAERILKQLTDRFTSLFDEKSLELSKKMVKKADSTSKTALKKNLEKLTGKITLSKEIPPAMKQITKSVVSENVALIKSIPEQYFKNITGAVMRSISTGGGVDSLFKYVNKNYEMSDARAKNLALDQTRKAYNSINKQRMVDVGYKKFMWAHSGGGLKPRKSHMAMDGKVFSFNKLPVINKEQVAKGDAPETGIPGQAINCGCTMVPIYEFPSGEKA